MLNILVNEEYKNLFNKIRIEAPDSFLLQMVNFAEPDKNFLTKLRKADAIIGQVNLTDSQYNSAKKLRIIQTLSAGYDKIDLKKAKVHSVIIANNNGANAISVAEHVLMLIFGLYRRLIFHHQSVLNGSWKNLKYQNTELQGKNLGIYGLGNVGKALAKKAKALGVNVNYFDIERKFNEEKKHGIKYILPDELLKKSDIVSYHVPKTKYTHQIINKNTLYQMRKNSILINTSRGYIHDENAIYNALSKGIIFGAGLDVFEKEPLQKNSPLKNLSNIILTPHSAPDKESYLRSIKNAILNIKRVTKDIPPLSYAKDYDELTIKFLKKFPKLKLIT